jgi:hypothetical protein
MKQMISVWFFIGCLLSVYGFLIFSAGLLSLAGKSVHQQAAAQLHLPIWWGVVMIALGLTYVIHFRPRR